MRRLSFLLFLSPVCLLWGQRGVSLFKQAELFRKRKEYQAALEKYNEAIQLEPYRAIYHFRKGEVLERLKRYEEAIISYQRALELNPGLAIAYVRMAGIYIERRDYDAAINAYRQAYTTEMDVSKKIKLKLEVVGLLNERGRAQEALSELSELKKYFPQANEEVEVIYAEGETYLSLNQPQRAVAAFQRIYDRLGDAFSPDERAKYAFILALAHYKAYETYARQIEKTPYGRLLKETISRSHTSR